MSVDTRAIAYTAELVWMADINTEDAGVIHIVFENREMLDEMKALMREEFGPDLDENWKERLVPEDWECNGTSGCSHSLLN